METGVRGGHAASAGRVAEARGEKPGDLRQAKRTLGGRGPGGKAAAARQGPCSAKGATSARATWPRRPRTSSLGVHLRDGCLAGRAGSRVAPGDPGNTESARLGAGERGGHPLPSDDTRQREGDPPEGFGGRPAGQNETNGPHEAQGQLKRNGIWLLTWPSLRPQPGRVVHAACFIRGLENFRSQASP